MLSATPPRKERAARPPSSLLACILCISAPTRDRLLAGSTSRMVQADISCRCPFSLHVLSCPRIPYFCFPLALVIILTIFDGLFYHASYFSGGKVPQFAPNGLPPALEPAPPLTPSPFPRWVRSPHPRLYGVPAKHARGFFLQLDPPAGGERERADWICRVDLHLDLACWIQPARDLEVGFFGKLAPLVLAKLSSKKKLPP